LLDPNSYRILVVSGTLYRLQAYVNGSLLEGGPQGLSTSHKRPKLQTWLPYNQAVILVKAANKFCNRTCCPLFVSLSRSFKLTSSSSLGLRRASLLIFCVPLRDCGLWRT